MSKASEWAKVKMSSAPTFLDYEGWSRAEVNPDGRLLIVKEALLSASDALRLRDWITETFDEPKETVTITRSQFWDAIDKVCDLSSYEDPNAGPHWALPLAKQLGF